MLVPGDVNTGVGYHARFEEFVEVDVQLHWRYTEEACHSGALSVCTKLQATVRACTIRSQASYPGAWQICEAQWLVACIATG